MKARVIDKSSFQRMQEEFEQAKSQAVDQAQTNAIKLCVVTFMQSLVDVGLAESTIQKILKKEKSYIDSVRGGNVTYQEIAQSLEEEHGMTFNWIGE